MNFGHFSWKIIYLFFIQFNNNSTVIIEHWKAKHFGTIFTWTPIALKLTEFIVLKIYFPKSFLTFNTQSTKFQYAYLFHPLFFDRQIIIEPFILTKFTFYSAKKYNQNSSLNGIFMNLCDFYPKNAFQTELSMPRRGFRNSRGSLKILKSFFCFINLRNQS